MINLKKVGLTALAGSLAMFTVVQAEVALTGSSEATYTTSDKSSTGNGIGYSNDFNIDATGEFNNGYTYTTHLNFAGQDMAADSNSLTVDMGELGAIAIDQGAGINGISKITNYGNPSAYEEAGHGVSSLGDKLDDGETVSAIGYSNTMSGVTVSIELQPTTQTNTLQAGGVSGIGATKSNVNYYVGMDVPNVEGLSMAFGGSNFDNKVAAAGVEETDVYSAGVKYKFDRFTVGLQMTEASDGASGATQYMGTQYGILMKVNEEFSVSYSAQDMEADVPSGTNVTEESQGISAAYSMGSASVRFSYNESDNPNAVLGTKDDNTELSLSLKF
jgi:outer membrane protein OmpU